MKILVIEEVLYPLFLVCLFVCLNTTSWLPARASEQGNVIGLVSMCIYIYIHICVQKKIVIERTRDLIYLKL